MTENQIRQRVVNVRRDWVGATMGSAKHYDILNTYNGHKPLARGYAIKPTDAYCAATVSAAWIKAGVVQIAVTEVGVPQLATLAQKKGIWVEDDAYVPKPGDAVIYDWNDGKDYAKTDNRGIPKHVGIVQVVKDGVITVIEGNMGSAGVVGRRALPVNGRYIRGFICPKYKSLAAEETSAAAQKGVCNVNLPILREGSRGGYVKSLQILLNAYYGYHLATDGIFGPATKAAVMGFQGKEGLDKDGIVGPRSWVALLR